jgi:hypothetical protein
MDNIESILRKAIQNNNNEPCDKNDLKIKPVKIVGETNTTRKIGYNQIKKGYASSIKEDINKWTNKDCALYIYQKFSEKYKETWDVKMIGVTIYVSKVKESILKNVGSCDNFIFKRYIDYFFDNFIDHFIQKGRGDFFIQNLRDKKALTGFVEYNDYILSVENNRNKKDIQVSEDSMRNLYMLSLEAMLFKFGLVLSISYLKKFKNMKENDAIANIKLAINKIGNDEVLKSIIFNTVNLSPYPESISFCDIKKISDLLKNDANKVKFTKKRTSYDFLKEE